MRNELGGTLWEMQERVLEAVRDHTRVAVRSCNGSGKTYAAAYTVLWWLMCFGDALVITTAPTDHQVRDILWREIRRAYRGHEELIDGRLLRTSLELGDKHYANGLSTNTPDRFQGFHADNILFVVDEAPGVREEIFDAIEGSMTSARARMLLLGNPTARRGTFYEAFHSRRELWHTIHISAFDTPNLTADEIVLAGLVTPKWVADAAVNWGESSPMYQVRVLGEFPSDSEDTLIPLKLIEESAERWKRGEAAEGDEDEPLEIGVDVARYGSDKTVLCTRRGQRVLSIESFGRQDTMVTTGHVARAIEEGKPAAVRIDEIGIGAGVVDRLKELGHKMVVGVNVSTRASRPDHFANLRAELYDGLRRRFEEGRIAIPDDRELIGQLAALRYQFTSSGQMKLEEKDDLRRRGHPSPDRADALALAFGQVHRGRKMYRMWG